MFAKVLLSGLIIGNATVGAGGETGSHGTNPTAKGCSYGFAGKAGNDELITTLVIAFWQNPVSA